MEPLSWATLATLIANEGIQVAEKIYQKWASGSLPTQADFDEIRAVASVTALDRAKAALTANAVDLNDPKVKEILAHISASM